LRDSPATIQPMQRIVNVQVTVVPAP
jgi:hypothetical protein